MESVNVAIMREMIKEINALIREYKYRVQAYKYSDLNELVVCFGNHNPALDDEEFLNALEGIERKYITIDPCGDYTGPGVNRL